MASAGPLSPSPSGWAIGLGCVGVAGTMLSTFYYIFHRDAAHRGEHADRRAALGLGGRGVRPLRAHRPHLAVDLRAIPHEQDSYYYLALGAAALGYAVVWALRRSRLGFRLQAMRDESEAAASLGIAIARQKVVAFMISAAMMSVAGTFYTQYVLVLDPERLLSAEISIIVVLMTVLGGSGTASWLQQATPTRTPFFCARVALFR